MTFPLSRFIRPLPPLLAAGLLAAAFPFHNARSEDRNSAASALADGKLAGLYVRQQMIPFAFNGRMTFNLRREFFYFFPDGHILFGVPATGLKERPVAADFAAIKDADAEHRGTYAVAGGQITFTYENGKSTTEPFSIPKPGDDSVLQIGPKSTIGSVKALPFKNGQKFDAAYQFDATVGLGGTSTVFAVKTLTFRPDGTLSSEGLTGVDSRGIDTTVGNSGVTTHANSTSLGTYRFDGYTLEMKLDGKVEKVTAFRWAGDEPGSTPGLICLAARVYSRLGPKK